MVPQNPRPATPGRGQFSYASSPWLSLGGSFKARGENSLIFLPQQVEFDSLYLSAGWTWYVLPESRIQPTSGGIISEMRVSKTVASF